jgi:hypothetical protein
MSATATKPSRDDHRARIIRFTRLSSIQLLESQATAQAAGGVNEAWADPVRFQSNESSDRRSKDR